MQCDRNTWRRRLDAELFRATLCAQPADTTSSQSHRDKVNRKRNRQFARRLAVRNCRFLIPPCSAKVGIAAYRVHPELRFRHRQLPLKRGIAFPEFSIPDIEESFRSDCARLAALLLFAESKWNESHPTWFQTPIQDLKTVHLRASRASDE